MSNSIRKRAVLWGLVGAGALLVFAYFWRSSSNNQGNSGAVASNTSSMQPPSASSSAWLVAPRSSISVAVNSTPKVRTIEQQTAADIEEKADPAVSLALGKRFTCARTQQGKVRCWGDNRFGQLGLGHTRMTGLNDHPFEAGWVDLGTYAKQIATGADHACVILVSDRVRCWGKNEHGQLGYGHTSTIGDDEKPSSQPEVSLSGKPIQLALGAAYSCALLDGGRVQCWGQNQFGQLGYGHKNDVGATNTPASAGVINLGAKAIHLAAGHLHACAILEHGNVRCWGYGNEGQLGYANRSSVGDDETPASVGDVKLGGKATQLALGGAHSCALLESGNVRCWGLGIEGRLGHPNQKSIGDDEHPESASEVSIGGRVRQISAGQSHSCVLLDSGKARCWGFSGQGFLGYETRLEDVNEKSIPSALGDIDTGEMVTQIAAGPLHTCALLVNHKVRCWGEQASGQLGYGTPLITLNKKPSTLPNVLVF